MQLIRAKLRPPRLSPDLVPRPRLVQQLNAGLARKLSLVSAPAGFGKTTLLSEWVQQASCPVAWVSLDSNDDNLHSFLTYFVAAITTVFPHSCAEIQGLLNIPTLPPGNTLVAVLANELAMLDGEMILVLDDYHALQQMAIHDLMVRLITYLPPNFHLVLGTRGSPPLSLVTLRAQGQICELRQPHLRFTSQETRSFFVQGGEIALDDAMLEELDRRTEGWPAGLRLLLLSIVGENDLRSLASRFTLGDFDIMSYLTDQVLAKQSPALQHFLLCTAITERFTHSLYAHLAPEISAREENEALLLQSLRDNLFVVALGEGWYRYHPLFRELLLHRHERQIGRQGLAELHRRASGWLEQNGLIDDAIRHALLARDEAMAIAVLDRHRIKAMNQEQWSPMERWLALFSRTLVEKHPILTITQVWILSSSDMGAAQEIAMKRLEQQIVDAESFHYPAIYDPAIYRTLLGEYNALLSNGSFDRGEYQAAIAQARRGLELLPIHHSHARSIGYIALRGSYQYMGNFAQADETLEATKREEPLHNDTFSGRVAIPRFVLDFVALRLKEAEWTALELKARAQQGGLLNSLCWANYYLGRVAYVQNRLDDARKYFEEVIAHRHAARFTPAIDTFLCLALIDQAQGKPQAAIQTAEVFAQSLRDGGAEKRSPIILSLNAHLAILQGRLDEAVAWVEQTDQSAFYVPDAWSQKIPLTRLRVMLAKGSTESLDEAARMIAEMQQMARLARSQMHLTQLLVFEALLHEQLGAHDVALATLEEALILARPSRAIRLFADLGSDNDRRLCALLHTVDEQSHAHDFAQQILAALSPATTPPQQKAPASPVPAVQSSLQIFPVYELFEHLTQREMEILVLIDKGMSNKEIAQHLSISDKTVENHTNNIYQKLDVRNRIQAARRAKELLLLPPH